MALIDRIYTLNSWANESRILLSNVEDNLDWRVPSQYDKSQHGGIGFIAVANRLVLSELIEAMQWFVYGYSDTFDYVYWGNVHVGLYDRAEPLTWKSICEALITNDFEGSYWFISIIDRMRQLIWDEPYKIQWAAKPVSEPT